jgi:hypothetical protein
MATERLHRRYARQLEVKEHTGGICEDHLQPQTFRSPPYPSPRSLWVRRRYSHIKFNVANREHATDICSSVPGWPRAPKLFSQGFWVHQPRGIFFQQALYLREVRHPNRGLLSIMCTAAGKEVGYVDDRRPCSRHPHP